MAIHLNPVTAAQRISLARQTTDLRANPIHLGADRPPDVSWDKMVSATPLPPCLASCNNATLARLAWQALAEAVYPEEREAWQHTYDRLVSVSSR